MAGCPFPDQDLIDHWQLLTEICEAVAKRQQEMKAPTARSINGVSRAPPVRTGKLSLAQYCAVGSMQLQLTIDLMQIGFGNADQAARSGLLRRRFRPSKTILEIQNITYGVHTSCTPEHVRPMDHLQFPSTPPLATRQYFASEVCSITWGSHRREHDWNRTFSRSKATNVDEGGSTPDHDQMSLTSSHISVFSPHRFRSRLQKRPLYSHL
jgi:hypothetical protein